MRDYAKSEPKMWHGRTFKALRKDHRGLIVSLYLMTSPSSNMLGLFAQPLMYMAYETGLGIEGASEGLRQCIEAGYCSYDEESEFVWVHTMAAKQIASELKATDLRCKGIQKEYDGLPDNPFLERFYLAYQAAFHLTRRRVGTTEVSTFSEAPCKPLRSQEQEQEQAQEQEQEQEQAQEQEKNINATSPRLSPAAALPAPGLPGIEEPPEQPKGLADCPHQQLVALYGKYLPQLTQPRIWDGNRVETMRARWKQASRPTAFGDGYLTQADGIAFWDRFFEFVSNCPPLASGIDSPNRPHWEPDLPWLMKAENFAKVIEGKYIR